MGTTAYPGAYDDFAGTSPARQDYTDSTGRTHDERHDDMEAAMEAVQTALGLNPRRTVFLADGAPIPGGTPAGSFIVRYNT